MQFTLKQLLSDPANAQFLTADSIIRLKTDLEHYIEHEHVLTQRVRMCRTALRFGNHPVAETAMMKKEIAVHQTTIRQLHTLYDRVCAVRTPPAVISQQDTGWQS